LHRFLLPPLSAGTNRYNGLRVIHIIENENPRTSSTGLEKT